MAKNVRVRAEPDREPRNQVAALPWRRAVAGGVEVLLITSRETRRWVIPKGWPIKGLASHEAAAREAFEEAGVSGDVAKRKLGAFHYDKRLASGRVQKVKVAVFALQVEAMNEAYPEAGQRERFWTSPAEAADLVQEPQLAELLRRFEPK
jgi:8-oxo-dGTP pyrophosphatase MutT (NUDIX family)